MAAHRRRSWSRSWATGRTSVTLSTTTNAPSRRFAHRWSSAMEASAGPERCGWRSRAGGPGRGRLPGGPGRSAAQGGAGHPAGFEDRHADAGSGVALEFMGVVQDRQLGVGVRDTGCIHARVLLAGRWTGDLNGVAPVCFGYVECVESHGVGAVRYLSNIDISVEGSPEGHLECWHLDVYVRGEDGTWRCRWSQATDTIIDSALRRAHARACNGVCLRWSPSAIAPGRRAAARRSRPRALDRHNRARRPQYAVPTAAVPGSSRLHRVRHLLANGGTAAMHSNQPHQVR